MPIDKSRAARRKKQHDLKVAAATAARQRAEARAEEIAPDIQRNGVAGYTAPRLAKDGNTFKRASRVAAVEMSAKRMKAAERFARSWEDGGSSVGCGASNYGERMGGGAVQTGVISDTVLAKLGYQNRQRDEFIRALDWLGALAGILQFIVLEGRLITVWAKQEGCNPAVAKGYLLAALDKLIEFYDSLRPKDVEKESPIRSAVMRSEAR